MLNLVADVGWAVVFYEPIQGELDGVAGTSGILLNLFLLFYLLFALAELTESVTWFKVLEEFLDGDDIRQEIGHCDLFACLFPRVHVDGHRNKGLYDTPGVLLSLGKNDQYQTKFIALSDNTTYSVVKGSLREFEVAETCHSVQADFLASLPF